MVLKLYGAPHSTATKRAAVVLVEKGVPFEFIVVDTAKLEQKTPEYKAKHPFGQIPLLDDEGLLLYESRAIGRYIAEKYADQGTPLLPANGDLKKKALFEQAASNEVANFDFFASQIWREYGPKKRAGLEPDQEFIAKLNKDLSAKLDAYEVILSKQKYITGDELSLIDLFHLPFGANIPTAGADAIATHPNVSRWFKEISDRPSWQALNDGVKSTV
ncbi:glutathione S-transferase [Agrocybe pediades]|nr:glutathione S-transferase [Agrocybe pediades]